MVTRKPVPAGDPALAPPNLAPYPVTPISTNEPLPFRVGDARNQMQTDSPSDSENAWGGEADDRKAGKELPESLRVGPPGYTPKGSQEMLRPSANMTNPYLKKENSGSSNGNESSAEAWGGFEERHGHQAAAGMNAYKTPWILLMFTRSRTCTTIQQSLCIRNKHESMATCSRWEGYC